MSTKPQSFKDSLKELAPAYVVSFVLCYMLFFFEPLNTYASNMLNFNYDLKIYFFLFWDYLEYFSSVFRQFFLWFILYVENSRK